MNDTVVYAVFLAALIITPLVILLYRAIKSFLEAYKTLIAMLLVGGVVAFAAASGTHLIKGFNAGSYVPVPTFPGVTVAVQTALPPSFASPTATPPLNNPQQIPTRPANKAASPATLVEAGTTTNRVIALTFSAVIPNKPAHTAQILDLLHEQRVPATFGVSGSWAETHGNLLQRIVDERHTLLNQGYSGTTSFTGRSPSLTARTSIPPLNAQQRRQEIERTDTILRQLVNRDAHPYFRPPYGDYDDSLLELLGQLGYTRVVLWSIDSRAWRAEITAPQIVQECLDHAAPGAILHLDVRYDADLQALPELIRRLRAQGYRFVTIDELLAAPR